MLDKWHDCFALLISILSISCSSYWVVSKFQFEESDITSIGDTIAKADKVWFTGVFIKKSFTFPIIKTCDKTWTYYKLLRLNDFKKICKLYIPYLYQFVSFFNDDIW